MESMIEKAENADKYELMSDGIVAEIEDKLFMIFTYGPCLRAADVCLQIMSKRAGE